MNPVHVGLYIILFVIVVGLAVTNPKLKGFMPTRKIPMRERLTALFSRKTQSERIAARIKRRARFQEIGSKVLEFGQDVRAKFDNVNPEERVAIEKEMSEFVDESRDAAQAILTISRKQKAGKIDAISAAIAIREVVEAAREGADVIRVNTEAIASSD